MSHCFAKWLTMQLAQLGKLALSILHAKDLRTVRPWSGQGGRKFPAIGLPSSFFSPRKASI